MDTGQLANFELAELLVAVSDRWNKECDEFDLLMDQLKAANQKITTLETELVEAVASSSPPPTEPVGKVLELQSDLNKMAFDLQVANCELEAANNARLVAEDKATRIRGELFNHQTALKNAKDETERAKSEARRARFDRRQVEERQAETKKELAEVQTQLADAQKALEAKQTHNDRRVDKLNKEISQQKTTINNQAQELRELKKLDAKGLGQKVKGLKARNQELYTAKLKLIDENKAYRKERDSAERQLDRVAELCASYQLENDQLQFKLKMAKATQLYKNGDEAVMLLPQMLMVAVDDEPMEQYQVQLLFTDGTGIWRMMTLDQSKKLAVAQLQCDQYAERTQTMLRKAMPRPSEETKAWAEGWLQKVAAQGWQVSEADVREFVTQEVTA